MKTINTTISRDKEIKNNNKVVSSFNANVKSKFKSFQIHLLLIYRENYFKFYVLKCNKNAH